MREALFATLGPLDGARVLDLFAGSGALAIEALSRGATHAVLVERDTRAAAAIRANLDALELTAAEATLVVAPARTALREARARADTYDLVLLDPPYQSPPGLGRELTEALEPLLSAGARVVAESDHRAPLELGLPITHERRYAATLIRIHSHGT